MALALTVGEAFAYQGNGNTPPATPVSSSIGTVVRDTEYTLTIQASSINGSAFISKIGSKKIKASFSGTGIEIDKITVTNSTTLKLEIEVSSKASVGYRSLTITNPNKLSVTTSDILYVIDRPAITAASITPAIPSSTNDLTAQVTSVINLDGSPITYSYQWRENGSPNGYTSAILPHQATSAGKSYSCTITPAKGTLLGCSFTTATVLINQDADSNGMQDEWEQSYFGNNGVDPNADADGDGMSNQSEYLFGLNPTDRKSKTAIKNKLKRSTSKFAYTRPVKKMDGVVYQVWVSTNLTTWTEQTSYTEVVTQADSNTEVIEVALPTALTSTEKKLFIRVSATP